MNYIEPDYGDDNYGEYKDDVMQGLIEPDGTPREPSEPDWADDDTTDTWVANTPNPWGEAPY